MLRCMAALYLSKTFWCLLYIMHKLPIHLFKYDDNQVALFAARVHEYAIQPSSKTIYLGALPLSLRASYPLNHVAPHWSLYNLSHLACEM